MRARCASFQMAAGAALIAALACESVPGERQSVIRVDGSSTLYPLTEAVVEEYQRVVPDARITVGVAGTGGGFKKFCREEIDIANASRPIGASEREACAAAGVQFMEIPVAYDGITIVVHPANDWVVSLTVQDLGRLWRHDAEGRLTRWSQWHQGYPDVEIRLFGAGVDSGTFDYFTEAVTGTAGDSRGDFTSSEDDNTLVQGVAGDRQALGFVGFAYYDENRTRLRAVPIAAAAGDLPVLPSADSIRDGTYRPLSRPVFIYVNRTAFDRRDVRALVDFYLAQAGPLSRDVGFVALNERAAALVRARVDARVTGTLYGAEHASALALDHLLGLP
jgi:phosphate transport system substrate-binding protein